MSRGMVIRSAIFLLGAFPLVSLIHVFNVAADVGALAVILYAVAGGCYLGHYYVKHLDEIPTRPARR